MNEEETLLDEFESAWLAGKPLSIDEFLAQQASAAEKSGADVESLLAELVRLEFEYRFKQSPDTPPTVQEYVDRYPTLGIASDLSQDELRLRHRFAGSYEDGSLQDDPLHTVISPLNDGSSSPSLKSNLLSGESVPSGRQLSPPTHSASASTNAWSGLRPRFRQEAMLGEGSFGVVHRAFDEQLDRHVAIKTLHPFLARDPDRRMALVDEARRAAKLDHPNLTTIYDVVVDNDCVHLVMRLTDGVPMDAWWNQYRQNSIDSHSQLDHSRTLASLMAQVSRAVHHAHLAGLIHCDLKPTNILVDSRGNPTVLDFGLAIQRSDQESLAGRIFGTPAYMSPEQTWGENHFLDGRSDIWSLGVILYRLLTGHLPFEAASTPHVLESIQTRAVTPPQQLNADVPDGLSKITMRCLSKRVEDRYETAADLADKLQAYADEVISQSLLARDNSQPGKLLHCPFAEIDLVGRDAIVNDAVVVLTESNHRLLTLTGMGGSGKTQVAVAVAYRLSQIAQDHSLNQTKTDLGDVVWVDVANATDGDQFAAAILSGLEIAQLDNESSIERTGQVLSVRGPVTLVLDNIEQIIDEAAELIGPWLAANSDLRLIVTSQLALRIRGERVVPVPALSTTQPVDGQLDQASELFVRRADIESDSDAPTNLPDQASLAIIRKIGILLDGNPLAIELAAARVGVLTLLDLHKRLTQSFAVLKSRRSDRPDRHQSLARVVAWSVELLTPVQINALERLAIWPAPMEIETAETLIESACSDQPTNGLTNAELDDPLDILDELQRRSLLRFRQIDGEMFSHADNAVRRYTSETSDPARRCEVASAYIQKKLDDSIRPQTAASRQHAAANLCAAVDWLGDAERSSDLAVRAVLLADRFGADQLDSRLRVERLRSVAPAERSSLRAEWLYRLADAKRLSGETKLAEQRARELIDWLGRTNELEVENQADLEVDARRLLSLILFRSGRADEAIELLEPSTRTSTTDQVSPQLRVEMILELIEYQRRLGHFDQAEQWLTEGHRIRDAFELDSQLQTGLVIQEGKLALQRGQITLSRNLFDRALQTISAVAFEPKLMQQALLGRAAATAESGDFAAAELDYDRCERISRQLGDLPTLAQSLNNRALAADDAGDSRRACELLNQALEIYRRLGDRVGTAIALAAEAAARLSLDQPSETLELLESADVTKHLPSESIHQAIRNGDLGVSHGRLGELDQAERHLQQCLAQLDRLDIGESAERLIYEVQLLSVRLQLGQSINDDVLRTGSLVEQWRQQPQQRKRVQQSIQLYDEIASHLA